MSSKFQTGSNLKKKDDVILEPVELNRRYSQDYMGPVMEKPGARKAELVNMTTLAPNSCA